MLNQSIKDTLYQIMKEELIPAMGCTEPIALAYACAKAKEVLGQRPEWISASCSGNIIKNVRCVFIPNSNGMTGIEAACVLGALGGSSAKEMEVLADVTPAIIEEAKQYINAGKCEVSYLDSEIPLHFVIEMKAQEHQVALEVKHSHMNITKIEKDGQILFEKEEEEAFSEEGIDRSILNLDLIKEYADTIEIEEIKPLFERVIRCNMAIAEEGMKGKYGVGIGNILQAQGGDVYHRIKAYAAAGSEARMGGCDLPVIINSGSGNQGIASSVPVIVYAMHVHASEELLYRSLVFSALLTIYQKEFIGRLSAFCGAVSATCSSGAAITYMEGGTIEQIQKTIDSTLAITPGIICDGAKISCAAKIASGLDASLLAHTMAMNDKQYEPNTGILKDTVDETIHTVGHIGKVGMKDTDKEIIKSMLK